MPGNKSAFELTLDAREEHQTLSAWLYWALRRAILEGRLRSGTRLPATRDFALQYGVSRGIVVGVFEQLQLDGYVSCRVGPALGSTTVFKERLPPKPDHWRWGLGYFPSR
jgi:GntR family transcriptional regulator/MocR family aminotransferase